MPKIAYLVSHNYEELVARAKSFKEEFSIFAPLFRYAGVAVEKVIWSENPDLSSFDALIPKAVWDYFDKPQVFREFLNSVDQKKIRMINPVSVVNWNMDKRYLSDVREAGFPVLDFKFFPQGSIVDLTAASQTLFTSHARLLVKPSISGGGKNTVSCFRKDLPKCQNMANEILEQCDLVIQPFYEEVEQGEYSFFFFGEEFSHAILKVPAKGDFRAHSFYNSTNLAYSPSSEEIDSARGFIAAAPERCTYARVDVLKVKGAFHLVELEVIEPYFYLELAPDLTHAAEKFVKAIAREVS